MRYSVVLALLLSACATIPVDEEQSDLLCTDNRVRVNGVCVVEAGPTCAKDEIFLDGTCRPEP